MKYQLVAFLRPAHLALGVFLVLVVSVSSLASVQDLSPGEVKSRIMSLGSGIKAQATVKLKDGRVLKGYILQPGAEDFIMVTKVRAQAFAYSEVAEVKKAGPSTRGKAGILSSIACGLVIILVRAL
jgi:hypothetical protein